MASEQSNKKKIGYIVSHTHWDREWRYPIWATRYMLVDFLDELLEVLERGDYPGFLLDGQVSPINDYLEIRPENRERIEKLVRDGKLQVGPWYTLPDEYPVDGEAMVRNLLWGHRVSEQFGGVLKLGYTPFGWGQTAQLAQMYAGFGMDIAMIGKRVGKHRAPKCEFLWRGPDGSELLATRFGVWGRQNYYFYFHLSSLFGTDHFGPGWEFRWEQESIPYHRADSEQMEQDFFRLDPPAKWHPEYVTQEVIDAAWATMDESVMPDKRLMMNGCDYTAAQPMFPQMLEHMKKVDSDPDRDWVHITMPEFARIMNENIDRKKLPVVEGELRDGPANLNTGNALTTRIHNKILNKKAQNMLIRFAEPLGAVAQWIGAEYPQAYLHSAWDYLLAAHPHDSINGVTQDVTVKDVENRLTQVIEISQATGNRAMQEVIKRLDLSHFADDDVLVVAFNPLPFARREVAQAWVCMPAPRRAPTDWGVDPEDYNLYDGEGTPLATQNAGRTAETYAVAELHTRAFPYLSNRYLLYFDTGEIPAGGYKVFRVGPREEAKGVDWTGPRDRTGTLLKAPNVMENEYLRVAFNPNGTFDLTDKENQRTYAGLNYFEDRGEHGDYWINQRPMYNQVHSSLGSQARIWVETEGAIWTTMISEITMRIPKRGIREQHRRGDELEELTIKTTVTLKKGNRQIDVKVEFENRCEDHFLRACFPTGLSKTDHADSAGHFIVDQRPIHPMGPTDETYWQDMATQPMNNFVDLSDGKQGIAFLSDSLTEYEVGFTDERVVYLSLLRSVRNWVCTETRVGSHWPSQKGGQCLGRHELHYAIRPHSGDWNEADIPLAAEQFNVPLRLVQSRAVKGNLPGKCHSFYGIDNTKLRLAALKKTEDRDTFTVRLYNPTDKVQKGHIQVAGQVAAAWQTNLNEERAEAIKPADKNRVPVSVAPLKIATVEIEIK